MRVYFVPFEAGRMFANRSAPVLPNAKRIPQPTIATAQVKRRVNHRNRGNEGHIDPAPAAYFTWMVFAFSIARITPAKMTDIRKTVDRGKRNSERMSNPLNEID